jgi:beta-glucosidase
VRALREQARVFITFNEPNVFVAGGYLGGIMPPGRRSARGSLAAFANVFRAHAALYDMIHAQGREKAAVGVAHIMVAFHPASETSALDRGRPGRAPDLQHGTDRDVPYRNVLRPSSLPPRRGNPGGRS